MRSTKAKQLKRLASSITNKSKERNSLYKMFKSLYTCHKLPSYFMKRMA